MKKEWHNLATKDVFSDMKTSRKGLKPEQARERLAKYGRNEIKKEKGVRPLIILLQQFHSILIYILFAAAILSLIVSKYLDAIVIFAIVILNATLGFIQEYKAERTIERLREMLIQKSVVIRNGKKQEIYASLIVPGDILVLEAGEKIVADARLFEQDNLQINEAVLTGESLPVSKNILTLKGKTRLPERKNMVYAGTTTTRGLGLAIVIATGMQTEFGRIASLVSKTKSVQTPLQKKLNKLGKKLGIAIVTLTVLLAVVGIALGFEPMEMALTAITLAVAIIPEGLPAVVTISLAITIMRMVKVKSLIRKLPSAETLGRVTVICSDKTGTITAEEMTVVELFTSSMQVKLSRKGKFIVNKREVDIKGKGALNLLLQTGTLCNDATLSTSKDGTYKTIGDPTEAALLVSAAKASLLKEKLKKEWVQIKEFPFTAERKLMSVVCEKENKTGKVTRRSFVKGSPETILERCNKAIISGRIVELTPEQKKKLLTVYQDMASRALRVLGFAIKELPSLPRSIRQASTEYGLVFVGFQGMLDPPRPEVKRALQTCKQAGIRVIMLTGDSAITAKAIAQQINLKGQLVTGQELEEISEKELINIIKKIAVFARVTPKEKLRIIAALEHHNEIVAMTGDGVNDAPALKKADIGVAMGIRGTDVARDAADMILLDDNFASIVKAIKEGRTVYDNTKKFTKYLLSANLAEFVVIAAAIITRLPLPLLPLQILWMNLVTDSLPALALGTEKPEKGIMERKPSPHQDILHGTTRFIVAGGIIGFLVTMSLFTYEYLNGTPLDKARTIALVTLVLFELLLVFVARSDRKLSEVGPLSNRWIVLAVFCSFVLLLLIIYTPLTHAFHTVPLSLTDWGKIVVSAAIGFVLIEGSKYFRKKG